MDRYLLPNPTLWKGRKDDSQSLRFHEVVQCVNLFDNIDKLESNSIAFLGFASDEGIRRNQGRVGAAQGPKAFRESIAKMLIPLSLSEKIYDVGDIVCTDSNLEASQEALSEAVAMLLKRNIHPCVIGGGHEVSWCHYKGIASAFPTIKCAIVNIDAHLDLRPLIDNEKGSSGTSFLQIAQDRIKHGLNFHYACIGVQTQAISTTLRHQMEKFNVISISAEEIHLHGIDKSLRVLQHILNGHDAIYLTVDLDVFAAPFAPGVSAPQPLGLFPWQVIPLIRKCAESKKLIGFDIAELSPPHDKDGITASLASHLCIEWLTTR